MHHTAIAPAPTVDPNAYANAAAIQLQQHINANAKRTNMALEEGAVGDDPDAVAAARAAAVHAAASAAPGDAQFAQNLATAMARPRSSTDPSNTSRVEQLANEADQLAQNEAQRRALEQLEAQRQWREAKRREIAAKKAKGAASKRGRKKARIVAPTQPVVSAAVALQPASSQPSAQQSMAGMHIGVPVGYVSNGTAQVVTANVQPSQMTEDQTSIMYDGVHNVQNVEQMLQQSVEDGGNVAQNATMTAVISAPFHSSKATRIANPTADHTSAAHATVLAPASRRTGSFARPVAGIADPKHDASVVTTELLAASTEAALNAVPDANPNARCLAEAEKDAAATPEQLAQKTATESTAREGTDGKNEAANTAGDVALATSTIGAGGDSTTREGTEGKDEATEGTGDPQPSATLEEAPANPDRPETAVESAAEATEAGSEAKEAKGFAKRDVPMEGGDASTKEDTVTESAVQAATRADDEVAGETEGEKESRKEGDPADEIVAGIQQEGAVNTEKDMVNLGHEGQGSLDGNELQVPPDQDHDAEMKDDPQEGLEVDGGDGGEDIMTAAAWQSLDSISHT